jgi:ketosteroid isomerase-like protein
MTDILSRLETALQARDPEAVAACFAEDYRSSQPTHPGREFEGRAQVLANWTSVFEGVPDFSARLVASSIDGATVWGEWDWRGSHPDGSPFAMRGVTLLEVRDDLIAVGRLYMDPVDLSESSIDEAVEKLYGS